jgi:hypothetical protein
MLFLLHNFLDCHHALIFRIKILRPELSHEEIQVKSNLVYFLDFSSGCFSSVSIYSDFSPDPVPEVRANGVAGAASPQVVSSIEKRRPKGWQRSDSFFFTNTAAWTRDTNEADAIVKSCFVTGKRANRRRWGCYCCQRRGSSFGGA